MRTSETRVEPISVSVELRFDEIFVYCDVELVSEGAGLVPGGGFHLEAGKTGAEIIVTQEGVAEFVE